MAATSTTLSERGLHHGPLPRQRGEELEALDGDAAELCDRLTRARLRGVPEAPAEHDVVRFRRRWWDGAAHVPSMVVRSSRGRYRLAETAGGVIALPVSRRGARRALGRIRRPATCDPRLIDLGRTRPPATPERARITVVTLPDGLPLGRPSLPARSLGVAPLVRIDQGPDCVRCAGSNCAALVPVPPPGRFSTLPRCGSCGHQG